MSAAAAVVALLLQQPGGWLVTPARPTVGDTIWLERTVAAPPAWRVRAGKLAGRPEGEPLGDPVVTAVAGGWRVRYPVVVWTAGTTAIEMPPLWRLGPDGSADSLPGGAAALTVISVLPADSGGTPPPPRPALSPLRTARRTPLPAVAALLLSTGILAGLVAWRRRAPRAVGPGPELSLDPEVPDERWLAAGEPKAVAARATHHLRTAIARAVPEAHQALSTAECLALVAGARPAAPLRDLEELLGALDRVAFATAHGVDVAALAARARTLAGRLPR